MNCVQGFFVNFTSFSQFTTGRMIMRRFLTILILLLAAPFVLATPADGNGNKFVGYWEEFDTPIYCDGDAVADLTVDVVGWWQGREFTQAGNRNVELTVYHLDFTYTNSNGDVWIWRDRGPDRLYFVTNEGGVAELHLAITGRSGLNIIGHAVLNLDTGEFVIMAGQHPFGGEIFGPTSDDFACEVLF
jgi:hypothetical protein